MDIAMQRLVFMRALRFDTRLKSYTGIFNKMIGDQALMPHIHQYDKSC